jgi:hypothetical protein
LLIPLALAAVLPASPARAAFVENAYIRDPSGALAYVSSGVMTSINNSGETVGLLATDQTHWFLRDPSGNVTVYSLGGSNVDYLPPLGPLILNDVGQVAGTYISNGHARGLFQDASGNVTKFDAADPTGGGSTNVLGLNNLGQVAGTVVFLSGTQSFQQGYIRSAAGAVTMFNVPGSSVTSGGPINDAGQVAGVYAASGTAHGYLRGASGAFTSFDIPGSSALSVSGINQAGEIVGNYASTGSNSLNHGFLRDPSGTIATFDVPGSLETSVIAVNDFGVVAGYYMDSPNHNRGFIRDASGAYTTFDVSGLSTTLTALNNTGQVTILAVPEPGSALLLAVGVLGPLVRALGRKLVPARPLSRREGGS